MYDRFDLEGVDVSKLDWPPFPKGCTLAEIAQAMSTEVDRSEPHILAGVSMGGMVAQELIARSPRQVQALVLAATSPAFGSPGGAWQAEFLRSRFAPLDAGLGMAGLAAQLVPTMAGRDAPPGRLDEARALMAGVPEPTYRSALAALVQFDRREALARIGVPTLVVTGEDDRAAAPEVARRMAAHIGGSELAIVPATGHLLMLEQPEAFDRVLLDFVARRLGADVRPPAAPKE